MHTARQRHHHQAAGRTGDADRALRRRVEHDLGDASFDERFEHGIGFMTRR
ncbi:hypothetical protein AB0N09_18650 [Streptomyces erythrochromogenes]|uniref:hypothetical protein n=1 Tax=Streptomyces erythrochromogenes TaxID=285574 RepID=UPI0034250DD9